MIKRWCLTALVILSGLMPAFQVQASGEKGESPEQIVANVLKAYGGRTALERVKAIRHTGSIDSNRLGRSGSLVRLFEPPGRLRVDIVYQGGPHEQRITTPEGAWRDGRPATEPMHRAMELQAARFRLPLILEQKPVVLLGEENKQLRLGMRLTETTSLEVFVDKKSWRIVRSVGRMHMGGMSMAFSADYSDFRKVEGVLFAHREELSAMGMATGTAVLERIEINPKIGPDNFHAI